MAKFRFQAKNSTGAVQTGFIEGRDETDITIKLKTQNLTLVKAQAAPKDLTDAGMDALNSFMAGQVPSKELQIFTRQFSTLINSGIAVNDALKMLSEGKRNPQLKLATIGVRTAIENGKSLSEGMALSPLVFDKFYINMIKAGEEAGILEGILNRLAIYLEKSEKIKKQVKGALSYPAVILFVASVVILGILLFVIPKFQAIFASAGRELPAVTQLVVNMSSFVLKKWYIVLAGVVGIPIGIKQWSNTPDGKKILDRTLIHAPVFGDLIQKSSVAKMTRTLSTLLSSGVGVIQALDIASKTAGNCVIEEALERCKENVSQGKPIAVPLAREKAIPDMVVQMITIGEQSGNLDGMLAKIADFYEDDVENAVKSMTSLIEPLMMMFLGVIIAFLVIAMYLPIFDMANGVK